MAVLKLAKDRDLLHPCEAGPSAHQVMDALPHVVFAASHTGAADDYASVSILQEDCKKAKMLCSLHTAAPWWLAAHTTTSVHS